MSLATLYLKLAPKLNKTTIVRGPASISPPPTSGDLDFVHSQALAASTWVINHNLNKYPSITVIDSAGDVVFGIPTYTSTNSVTITFSAAFTGTAYLN